jgi:integrase/recombinase XerD
MISGIYPRTYQKYISLPLFGLFIEDFAEWLKQKGYEDSTIKNHLGFAPHIEAFFRERGTQRLDDLTCDDFEEAWAVFCRERRVACGTTRLIKHFLVDSQGLKPPVLESLTPTCRELDRFGRHLRCVRGLAGSTIRGYMAPLKEFLEYLGFDEYPGVLADLTLKQIYGFLEKRAPGLQRRTVVNTVSFLRAFLRFEHEQGVIPKPLYEMIDSPRIYRHEQLPRALPWETVRALLASVDRGDPNGIRSYAILLLMATYGMRSSEVASLTLEDIDWNAGIIRIRKRKSGTPLVLPLIDEVGVALVEYIEKARPESDCRELFLRRIAPSGPLTAGAIRPIFHSCIVRSGLDIQQQGPHCIRHSFAVHLLREGTTLKTIGDLLGHRDARSTCVYLRLSTEDLRDVALPVPRGPDIKGPLDLRILVEPPDGNGEKRLVFPQPASFLAGDIESFVNLKHALGLKYRNGESSLRMLDSFIVENYPSSGDLTAEIFCEWLSSMSDLTRATRNNRLYSVRDFCLYRLRFDENAFVPGKWVFLDDAHKFVPYIFSEADVARILSATRFLKPHARSNALRAQTVRLGLLLLYTGGMRSGELLNLKICDFNPPEGTLLIRDTKFRKSRVIPLSPSVILEVEEYLYLRLDKRLPLEMSSPLMLSGCNSPEGRGYKLTGFRKMWHAICSALGIFTPQGATPRLHDLRHSFAVNALKRWYEDGVDVGAKLPMLSTYMGHADISSTHYYIPFAKGVAEEASALFHSRFGTAVTCQDSDAQGVDPAESRTGGVVSENAF